MCRTEPEHRGDTDVHGGPAMLLSDVKQWLLCKLMAATFTKPAGAIISKTFSVVSCNNPTSNVLALPDFFP